ncbi:MAG TPA: hypothetical protein VGM20_11100 [Gemmatimonadales bacterium]|jgi:hypothetical protein
MRFAALILAFALPAAVGAQTAPQFQLTREVTIDGVSENLSPVTWLAVSPRGTIAVGQQQDHLIRYFDAMGKSLGTFGREGEGPGEFRQLTLYGAGWIGDTMWVTDNGTRRFTLIGPDRKLLRIVPAIVAIKAMGDSGGETQILGPEGLYRDGSQLVVVLVPSTAEARPHWARDPQYLDSRLGLIAVKANGEFDRLVTFEPHDVCGMVPLPTYQLCGRPKLGIDPTAERFGWAAMSYASPDSGTYRITMVGRDGKTIYSRAYPFAAQPIPKRIRDSLAELGRKGQTPTVRPAYAPRFGPPTIYPAVENVIVGADGTAWVGLRATPAGKAWVMLSPRGDVVGTAMAPANVVFQVLGHGVVWGTEKNMDDVESVVRFRVTRR